MSAALVFQVFLIVRQHSDQGICDVGEHTQLFQLCPVFHARL